MFSCLPHGFPNSAEANVALEDLALEEFLHTPSLDTTSSEVLTKTNNLHTFKREVDSSPPFSTGFEPCQLQNAQNSPVPHPVDVSGSGTKKGTRFSRAILSVLKGWVEDHRDNPYPDEAQKEWLRRRTGLTSEQICNWFTNTRRRERIRTIKRQPSPSIRQSRPIAIVDNRGWESLNPMERWRNSPPEQDPAPLAAIKDAARDLTPLTPSNYFDSSWNLKRTPSASSLGDGQSASDGSSVSAFSTTFSQDSHGSFGSFMSHQSNQSKQSQRRRRRVPAARNKSINLNSDKSRIFQCTFCTDRFKTKHDWARHEKTLHLSLEKWVCLPAGNPITVSSSGQKTCAFCDEPDPSSEHMEIHKYQDCFEKGLASRTFYRKDHLDQHLRLMHHCKITKSMASWKMEITDIKSRCGFCGEEFTTWQQRKDHLAKEFRTGHTMKDWQGCRGFEPGTAALVANSLPPYLIDTESKAPLAFSASNKASLFTHQQWSEGCVVPENWPNISNRPNSGSSSPYETLLATPDSGIPTGSENNNLQLNFSPHWEWPNSSSFWEYISFHLSLYVQEKQAAGLPITEDMLRREARQIKYGDPDDVWDRTPADDPYWLQVFMQAHGIVPPQRDFSLADLIQDLGLMTTLGFSKKDPSQYSLDGIFDEVSQALGRLVTIPNGCAEQMPQTGGVAEASTAHLEPFVMSDAPGMENEWSLLPSDNNMLTSSDVMNPEFTENSGLCWNNLTSLSLQENMPASEMPFNL